MEMEDAVEVLPSSASCMISASGWKMQCGATKLAAAVRLACSYCSQDRPQEDQVRLVRCARSWLFSQQLALLLLQWAIGLALHSCAPRVTLLEPASATREASADALVMTDGQRFSLL